MAAMPTEPLALGPWQHRMVELLLDQQNRHHLIIWGRQCGKTAIAREVMRRLAEQAAADRVNPLADTPNTCNPGLTPQPPLC